MTTVAAGNGLPVALGDGPPGAGALGAAVHAVTVAATRAPSATTRTATRQRELTLGSFHQMPPARD
jgi:hypothetical protein